MAEPRPVLPQYLAFHAGKRVAQGTLREVALQLALQPEEVRGAALIFDAVTSAQADIDFEGPLDDLLDRTATREAARLASTTRPRGRPRLGVVAREVTLLPRHWEWLNEQPGGASVALRKLVETARRNDGHRGDVRRGQEAAYRFMAATLGDAPGFEEAVRALFQADARRFETLTAPWPADLRGHLRALAAPALAQADHVDSIPDATGG